METREHTKANLQLLREKLDSGRLRSARIMIHGLHAAEIARLLPVGTHRYDRFIRPSELSRWLRAAGLVVEDISGLHYNPLSRSVRPTLSPPPYSCSFSDSLITTTRSAALSAARSHGPPYRNPMSNIAKKSPSVSRPTTLSGLTPSRDGSTISPALCIATLRVGISDARSAIESR